MSLIGEDSVHCLTTITHFPVHIHYVSVASKVLEFSAVSGANYCTLYISYCTLHCTLYRMKHTHFTKSARYLNWTFAFKRLTQHNIHTNTTVNLFHALLHYASCTFTKNSPSIFYSLHHSYNQYTLHYSSTLLHTTHTQVCHVTTPLRSIVFYSTYVNP